MTAPYLSPYLLQTPTFICRLGQTQPGPTFTVINRLQLVGLIVVDCHSALVTSAATLQQHCVQPWPELATCCQPGHRITGMLAVLTTSQLTSS